MPEDEKNVFENRIISFIDILGFKRQVAALSKNPIRAASLLRILQDIQSYCAGLSEGSDREITVFSDSIVISELVSEDAYNNVTMISSMLATKLLYQSIATRGGIVKGLLHHSNGIVFGDALIKAYELESKLAIYPRILLDFQVSGWMVALPALDKNWKILQDTDGMWYVNLFNNLVTHDHEVGRSIPNDESFFKMRRALCKATDECPQDLKAVRNWQWLSNKLYDSEEDYGFSFFQIPMTWEEFQETK